MSTVTTTSQSATSSPLRRLITGHPLVAYFVIAYLGTWALLVPFALSRNTNGLGLLPFKLPDIAFFVAFCLSAYAGPTLASLTVTAVTSGKAGVGQLLRRYVQWRVGIGWYLLALFSFFLIWLVGYSVFLGVNLPFALVGKWPLIFTVFLPNIPLFILVPALGEEPGWRGFALPRLQHRYGPLLGTIILGTLHGLWHLPVFFTALLGPFTLPNYAAFLFVAIAGTFVYTWIFNHTRASVMIAILIHAASNAAPNLLTPLVPAHVVVSGWAHPFVYGGWQGINVVSFGVCALLLIVFTRGRLGYRPDRVPQLVEAPQPVVGERAGS